MTRTPEQRIKDSQPVTSAVSRWAAVKVAHRTALQSFMRLVIRAAAIGTLGLATLGLSGCGFKMRGADLGLTFDRVMVVGTANVAKELRARLNESPQVQVVNDAAQSQVILTVMAENIERTVVSFSAAGRPREIQMRMRIVYRVNDRFLVTLSPPQEISQTRDISVNENEALAMVNAEAFMQQDMERDLTEQLIRRLRAIRLPKS
jgi:LPS-assembly lipoprotein